MRPSLPTDITGIGTTTIIIIILITRGRVRAVANIVIIVVDQTVTYRYGQLLIILAPASQRDGIAGSPLEVRIVHQARSTELLMSNLHVTDVGKNDARNASFTIGGERVRERNQKCHRAPDTLTAVRGITVYPTLKGHTPRGFPERKIFLLRIRSSSTLETPNPPQHRTMLRVPGQTVATTATWRPGTRQNHRPSNVLTPTSLTETRQTFSGLRATETANIGTVANTEVAVSRLGGAGQKRGTRHMRKHPVRGPPRCRPEMSSNTRLSERRGREPGRPR
ncbi:hypothetical protein GGS23DRAFT_582565 [Durotheca rogersii]|uniref:uncharacterized protein n=1 Tax=Durotheca rogersii TaxID=419775 RepID=UPI0022207F2D|nr:uncharacterized protein GGS23DRAFT_582565 [Durotheca rogersii]KAI5860098.1 hypothetical protein GGS23DRAFT_582565 [Durotheca rogersii]